MLHTQLFNRIKTTVNKTRQFTINVKEDGSYVTDYDLKLDKLIKDYFIEHYPLEDIEFISEEDNNRVETNNSNLKIVIDPIDGTENFSNHLEEWGVNISIYRNGFHLYSCIMLPDLDWYLDTFTSVNPISSSRIIGLSSGVQADELIKIKESLSEYREFRIMGSAAYNLFNVCTGKFKEFYSSKHGVHSWDILAGLNLIKMNRKDVTIFVNGEEWNGEYLPSDKKYVYKIVTK